MINKYDLIKGLEETATNENNQHIINEKEII